METVEQSEVFSNNNSEAFFRKRYNTTWAFALGVLLFLLPFSQVKCSSVTLAENSGLGIALGWEWKIAGVGNSNELLKLIKKDDSIKKEQLKEGPNIFAIAALLSGLVGLCVSLVNYNNRKLITLSAGVLGVVMLIGLFVQFKMVLQSSLGEKGSKDFDISSIITIQFTVWYFLSMFLFAAAAFISYKQYKMEMNDALKQAYDFEFERQKRSHN